MARLPIPGGDGGSWGTILNDFLSEAHTTSGAIKPSAVNTTAIANGAVTADKLSSGVGTSGQVLSSDGSNLTWSTPASATKANSGATMTLQVYRALRLLLVQPREALGARQKTSSTLQHHNLLAV